MGQQLEGLKVLMERYHNAGIRRISHDFYAGGRHEMLNEINRGEVRARLLGWISAVLEGIEGGPHAGDEMKGVARWPNARR